MRILRMRFTVRRLMLVVLIVAVAIGGWIEFGRIQVRLRRLKYQYTRLSVFHKIQELSCRRQVTTLQNMAAGSDDLAKVAPESASESTSVAKQQREQAALASRLADYEEALADKYRRAASRPWFSVAPDPPEPR